MKSFFRTVLAVIVGVLLLQLVGMFLFFMVIGGIVAATSAEEVTPVKSHSVLHMDMSTRIVDKVSTDPMDMLKMGGFGSREMPNEVGLYETVQAIRTAAEDDRIEGIVLHADGLGFSGNIADELRVELQSFRDSGKFIYAYSDGYGSRSYFLASVADSVFIHPMGGIEWKGMASTIPYLKGTCEKFGIEPQIIRHGKYKSAVEPFLDTEMSEANREQTTKILSSMWNYMCERISQTRRVSAERLNQIADEYVLVMPREAKELGLVDGLCYQDQFDSIVLSRMGRESTSRLHSTSLAEYVDAAKSLQHTDFSAEKIAVVYAQGDIKDSHETGSEIGGEGFAAIFRKLRKDSTIRAVVLRVNSPGGSALASETMWRELYRLKEEKPLVVSMGQYAASGGYYMSSPADYIVCDPLTITGSIGVFGMFMTYGKLAKDMLGVNMQTVKTNAHSDMGSTFRPLDAHERARVLASIENTYGVFLARVADGRRMTTQGVDSIAQGRVWTGIDAQPIGLIDEYGGLCNAIEVARERAGLDTYRLSTFPKEEDSPLNFIMKMAMKSNSKVLRGLLPRISRVDAFRAGVEELLGRQGIRAEIPFRYDIQ